MKAPWAEQLRLTFLAWLATIGTACCFLPAISNGTYLAQAALLVAVLSGLGVALRAVRTPAVAVLAGQLFVLAELLVVTYGEDRAWFFVPTGKTVDGLVGMVDRGFDVAAQYAAPTPESPGLTLLVLFSIGLVGALVDFFALGVRRVPLTGLPLLTLYTIPVTALPNGIPFYGFLPGAAAYVALLLADERDRLSHWGRVITRNPHSREQSSVDLSGLVSTGRQISVAAVATAVIVPIFVPMFGSNPFDGTGGDGSGPGGGDISFADPMVSLAQSLRRPAKEDVLRVSGSTRPQYLRMAVLDQPGPDNWSVSDVDLDTTLGLGNQLPLPQGLPGDAIGRLQRLQIEPTDEFPSDTTWLPAPFALRNVEIDGDWAYVPKDQTVTATTSTAGSTLAAYTVDFAELEFSPEQLEASGPAPAEMAPFAEVPTDLPAAVTNVARAVTQGATNDYERALLLQSFFRDRSQFTYDLDAAYGYGYEAMEDFLQERRGFCQHFSATMAMMARTLEIPSRVAVGFLQPDRIESDGTYVITSDDVHAWPELYFDGLGWVRFEPTPGVGAALPSYAPPFEVGNPTPTNVPSTQPTEELPTENPNNGPQTATPEEDQGAAGGGDGAIPPMRWVLVVLVIALLATPALLRRGVRRNRLGRPIGHDDAAESAWLELRDHIMDLRLPWSGSMTPRGRERAVSQLITDHPEGREALTRLARSVERSRYATSTLAEADPAGDAVVVMGALDAQAPRGQRLRATFLPPSLVPDLRAVWDRVRERRGPRDAGDGAQP